MGTQTIFPTKAGEYLTVRDPQNGDVVLCRLGFSGECPPCAVKLNERECLVAFSRVCPHMGCFLLPDSGETAKPLPRQDTQNAALLRCKCHFSCFDLLARGLTVVGPATDWLAQMELKEVPEDPKKVELVRWLRHGDVGYGVPFGHTSSRPEVPFESYGTPSGG